MISQSIGVQRIFNSVQEAQFTAVQKKQLIREILHSMPGGGFLGHLSFGVTDLARSLAFYDATLSALGFMRVWTTDRGAGYGNPGFDTEFFAIFAKPDAKPPGPGFHLAFDAASPEAVNRFFEAGSRTGGQDNGAPGLRLQYSPTYYAAFLLDPDGYRLEAVHQM